MSSLTQHPFSYEKNVLVNFRSTSYPLPAHFLHTSCTLLLMFWSTSSPLQVHFRPTSWVFQPTSCPLLVHLATNFESTKLFSLKIFPECQVSPSTLFLMRRICKWVHHVEMRSPKANTSPQDIDLQHDSLKSRLKYGSSSLNFMASCEKNISELHFYYCLTFQTS